TFLLLIFFMVTAAFNLQKSLEVPPPDQQEEAAQSQTLEELETDTDFIIVRIDADNYITVDGEDAPSEQELLSRLREAKEGDPASAGSGPTGMLVLADGDARHETLVMVLDAGNAVGMERIRVATLDETEL
ncbi:MAG: biopolymer transporter ExbD, partial [Planctomycetota bacterium]